MELLSVKQIISKTKNQSWFGTDYTLNLYRGCSHGCIYCDSRSECYRLEDFDVVKGKANAIELLEAALGSKRSKGVIGMGAMSDPYNPMERQYQLTANAIETIGRNGFGLTVTTKSDLIVRDIALLKEVQRFSPVLAKVTLTTLDKQIAKKIEPYVSDPCQRLDAVSKLSSAGIKTGVLLMPILPYITDEPEQIVALIHKVKEAGANFIYPGMGVTLRDRQRAYYFDALDNAFPGLKQKYMKDFGNQYGCGPKNAKQLYGIFAKTCESLGLLYRMKDIIQLYKKPYEQEQMSFF